MNNNVERLPKWAQRMICDLRDEIEHVNEELRRTSRAVAVTCGREGWFTIPGPPQNSSDETGVYRLYYLSRDGAHAVCSLGPGDVLLVGRKCHKASTEPDVSVSPIGKTT